MSINPEGLKRVEIEAALRGLNVPEHIVLDASLHGYRLAVLILDSRFTTVASNT
jgi:hypothetical protein